MNTNTKKALISLGLSENEIAVYLACLEVGSGSSLKISKKAGVPKSTAHDILLKLNKQGVVNQYPKKSRTYFSASDPNVFLAKLERQERQLKEILPELKALHHTGRLQPNIRFYNGREGMEIVMQEVLKEAAELRIVASQGDAEKRIADIFPSFPKERANKKIPLRIIFKDSPVAREFKEEDQKYLRTSKLITPETDITLTQWMWGTKVAFITLKESFSVTIIDDNEIAMTQRAFFESMWNVS